MSARVFRWLSALYPRAWRDRYADELADLCDEFVEAGEIARWRLVMNIVAAASAERLRSWRYAGHRFVLGRSAAAVVTLVILAAATDGFGSFNAALPSKGLVPIDAVVNGHIDLSRVPDFVSDVSNGRVVGYTPRADLFAIPTNGVHLGVVAAPVIKPVYGPDLKTLVGHLYPGTGFVPVGSLPSTKICNPEYTITNGQSQAIPCPSIGIDIPNVVGMYTPTGAAKLSSLGLSVQVAYVKSEKVTGGHIVSTSPGAGETVAARSVITVDSSVGT
jgi:hypothetical protein